MFIMAPFKRLPGLILTVLFVGLVAAKLLSPSGVELDTTVPGVLVAAIGVMAAVELLRATSMKIKRQLRNPASEADQ